MGVQSKLCLQLSLLSEVPPGPKSKLKHTYPTVQPGKLCNDAVSDFKDKNNKEEDISFPPSVITPPLVHVMRQSEAKRCFATENR